MALVLPVKIWFDIQKREGNEFRLWNNLSNLMKECLFEPHHLKKKNIPVTKRHNTTWRLTIRSNSSAIPIPLMKTRIRQTIIVPGQNPSATETWLEVEKKNLVIIVWSPENLFPARNQTSMAKLVKLYRYKYRYIYLWTPSNDTNLLDSLESFRQKLKQIPSSSHNMLYYKNTSYIHK